MRNDNAIRIIKGAQFQCAWRGKFEQILKRMTTELFNGNIQEAFSLYTMIQSLAIALPEQKKLLDKESYTID